MACSGHMLRVPSNQVLPVAGAVTEGRQRAFDWPIRSTRRVLAIPAITLAMLQGAFPFFFVWGVAWTDMPSMVNLSFVVAACFWIVGTFLVVPSYFFLLCPAHSIAEAHQLYLSPYYRRYLYSFDPSYLVDCLRDVYKRINLLNAAGGVSSVPLRARGGAALSLRIGMARAIKSIRRCWFFACSQADVSSVSPAFVLRDVHLSCQGGASYAFTTSVSINSLAQALEARPFCEDTQKHMSTGEFAAPFFRAKYYRNAALECSSGNALSCILHICALCLLSPACLAVLDPILLFLGFAVGGLAVCLGFVVSLMQHHHSLVWEEQLLLVIAAWLSRHLGEEACADLEPYLWPSSHTSQIVRARLLRIAEVQTVDSPTDAPTAPLAETPTPHGHHANMARVPTAESVCSVVSDPAICE